MARAELLPLTVSGARAWAKALWGVRIPPGPVMATAVVFPGPFDVQALAVAGPASDTERSSALVRVYGEADLSPALAEASLAAGNAALEAGYERVAVLLPPGAVVKPLKGAGWRMLREERAGAWWGREASRGGALRIVALSQAEADAWIGDEHEHHPASQGSMFSVGVVDAEGALHGAAQVGVVRARALMVGPRGKEVPEALGDLVGRATFDRVAEVGRVATDKTDNAASMLLGACARACFALGYRRLVSYTLLGELGWSYRMANWSPVAFVKGTREWSCRSRPRRDVSQKLDKIRWELGPEARVLGKEARKALEAKIRGAWEEEQRCPRILSRKKVRVVA